MESIRGKAAFAVMLIFGMILSFPAAAMGQTWVQVPIVSEANRRAGSRGGEGCQWPQALSVGKKDSHLMFYGTNTGGIYRSTDGGRNWDLAMHGIYSRGGNAFAIDPQNDNYILMAGSDDRASGYNGIYFSKDRGISWEFVLPLSICGDCVYLEGLVFDPTSVDKDADRCMRAYYSVPYQVDFRSGLKSGEAGLYCSEDGGQNWKLINAKMSDAKLLVNPDNGNLYAVRKDGLYLSLDNGKTFEALYRGSVTDCDIFWEDGTIYLAREKALLKGNIMENKLFSMGNIPLLENRHIKQVSANPLDKENLLLHLEEDKNEYGDEIYFSHDGGESWQQAVYDMSCDFFPYLNKRDKIFAWSNSDKNKVWSFGGDQVISSQDKGKNWKWDSNGISGALVGGKFQFNLKNPDILFFGFQDYNGALTTDGGNTWTYIDMSQKGYSGHVYGGYAANENILWGCHAASWYSPKYITISFDGGKTFHNTGKSISATIHNTNISSYQSYNDPEVFFACDYRSADGGKSWQKMSGCLQVYTHNPEGSHELYGCEEGAGYVLVSYDEGENWSRVNHEEIPLLEEDYINDIQIDEKNGIAYVAARLCNLYCVELETGKVTNLTGNLLKDNRGEAYVDGVAVDSQSGRVYVSGCNYSYTRDLSIQYSEDNGNTWKNAAPAGGQMSGDQVVSAINVRVQPKTGELWCSAGCYGILRLSKP